MPRRPPPISILFAAFLGYNAIGHLVGAHALNAVGPHAHAVLTGQSFFPHLISPAFASGLDTAFAFAIVACLIAAAASLAPGRPLPPRRGAGSRGRGPPRGPGGDLDD